MHQLMQQVFGKRAIDRQLERAPGEFRMRLIARDNRKRRHTADGKRFKMIAAEKENYIGFGFIQNFAELAHPRDAGIKLGVIFVRRISE